MAENRGNDQDPIDSRIRKYFASLPPNAQVSRADIAREVGVSGERIRQLHAQGRIHPGENRKILSSPESRARANWRRFGTD